MIDEKHYVTLNNKRFVLYEGLVGAAHEKGLRGIDTELLQVPNAENGNVAIVAATVHMHTIVHPDNDPLNLTDGDHPKLHYERYSGIGDASPENVKNHKVKRLLAMAETRSKARALRDALGIGTTALEELSDGEESSTSSQRTETPITEATPIRLPTSRQTRSRDDELTPGGVLIGRANELIDRIIKAGYKREEVAPYIWKANPEAFEKKWEEYQGKETSG